MLSLMQAMQVEAATERAGSQLLCFEIPAHMAPCYSRTDRMSILQEDNTQGRFVVEPKDLSSTEPYQRDNLAHFFMCVPSLHALLCPASGSYCLLASVVLWCDFQRAY